MPDRIIKESACTSDNLNQLTDFEERFWWRLIVNCDDYGRYDARPAILKGRLFPLREDKTQKNITDALYKLASAGLVDLYEVDGRPFLRVVNWEKHQRIRAKRSKFPAPADDCCQMTADDSKCRRNPIQSNPILMSQANANDGEKNKDFDNNAEAYKAAKYLDRRICENIPSKQPANESTLQRWAADIDKINRLDGQSWDDISDVLDFCQSDTFWQTNILSGKKFREKYIQLLGKMRSTNAK